MNGLAILISIVALGVAGFALLIAIGYTCSCERCRERNCPIVRKNKRVILTPLAVPGGIH